MLRFRRFLVLLAIFALGFVSSVETRARRAEALSLPSPNTPVLSSGAVVSSGITPLVLVAAPGGGASCFVGGLTAYAIDSSTHIVTVQDTAGVVLRQGQLMPGQEQWTLTERDNVQASAPGLGIQFHIDNANAANSVTVSCNVITH